MQINGKNKNIDPSTFKLNFYKIFNQLVYTKSFSSAITVCKNV